MAALSPAGAAPGPEGLILLTGATGYVGCRLLPILEASGRGVRCLVRRPEFLQPRVAPGTEVVPGDVFDARPTHSARLRGRLVCSASAACRDCRTGALSRPGTG
jgi:uncharacterized protein YbjT (DUF2867 family)